MLFFLQMMHQIKKIYLITIIFILICLFITHLFLGGTLDVEAYYSGIFSINFYFKNFSNFLLTFYDGIGPGMELPLGQGPFLFPLSILLFYVSFKTFLIITSIFCLIVQVYFFNKILECFNKTKFKYFHPFIVIFSLPNFSYLYFNDWYDLFVNYTFFFPIIYYLIKIKKNNNFINYSKLTFFIILLFANGHLGYLSLFIIFIFLFVIANNLFGLLKDKYFYFFLAMILFSLSDMFFHLFNQYSLSILLDNFEKKPQSGYVHLYDFKKALFYPFFIFQKIIGVDFISLNINYKGREPFAGIQLLISFFYSLKLLIFKESKNYYYINLIFLILIFLMTRSDFYLISFVSAIWQIRDIVNLLSSILFFLALTFILELKFKNFLKKICVYPLLFFCIFTSLSFFYNFSIYKKEQFEKYEWTGYLNNTNKNLKLEQFIEDINSTNELERIYFGDKFYNSLLNRFKDTELSNNSIVSFKDFVKFNLEPFNILSKNSVNIVIREPNFSFMHQWIYPVDSEVSNRQFTQLFQIKYFLEFKSNTYKYNLKNYVIEKKLNLKNDELVLYKNKYFKNKLTLKNFSKIDFSECPNVYSINCVLNNLNNLTEETADVIFNRKKINNYNLINNSNTSQYVILPFTASKNWKLRDGKGKLIIIGKELIVARLEPESIINLYYFDTLRYFLKILSLSSFFTITIIYISNIFRKYG